MKRGLKLIKRVRRDISPYGLGAGSAYVGGVAVIADVERKEENPAIIGSVIVQMKNNNAGRAAGTNNIQKNLGREWIHENTLSEM